MRAEDGGLAGVVWESNYLEEFICHVYSFHSFIKLFLCAGTGVDTGIQW